MPLSQSNGQSLGHTQLAMSMASCDATAVTCSGARMHVHHPKAMTTCLMTFKHRQSEAMRALLQPQQTLAKHHLMVEQSYGLSASETVLCEPLVFIAMCRSLYCVCILWLVILVAMPPFYTLISKLMPPYANKQSLCKNTCTQTISFHKF